MTQSIGSAGGGGAIVGNVGTTGVHDCGLHGSGDVTKLVVMLGQAKPPLAAEVSTERTMA